MTAKKKIFISYKRNVEPDEPVALEIFSNLSKEHDVFIDLKMMVGTKWSREIVFYKIKVAHLGKKLLTKSSPPIA